MHTLPPNDTQCGPPVDKQANMALLTSTPRAVGERKTKERFSPPDVDDDEFPWEDILKQKDACAEAMIIASTQYAHPSVCSHDCTCPSCSTSSEEDTEDEISESKFMERLNTLIEPMTKGQSPDEEDVIPKEIHGPESLQQRLREVCGKYRSIFRRKVRDIPAKTPPFMLILKATRRGQSRPKIEVDHVKNREGRSLTHTSDGVEGKTR